ncbi:MAG: mechanosensitive ion channel domain-containing protein [Candidatus Sulfotelmatobacter sp.]
MKLQRSITAIILFLLMALVVAGLLRTREQAPPAENGDSGKTAKPPARSVVSAPHSLVDQRPLQTARRMAATAVTSEELALAHQAEKVGDHEVDLAFFDALRTAEENPPKLSPEAQKVAERKSKAELALKEDQDSIAQLTRKLAAAPESQKDNLQDQIDVAKAQADLDQDEFDDASELLEQAGGDPQSKLKRLKAEHDASDHNAAQPGASANPYEQDYQAHIMLPVFRTWKALREKQAKLEDARQETTTKVERLSQRHDSLAAEVEHEKEDREAARQQAKSFSQTTKSASREESTSGAQAALMSLKQYSRDQKNLADLGRRIQDEKDLSDIYANWIGLVEIREHAALHHLLEGLLWILVVAVLVYFSHLLIDRLFGNITAENKRIATLRSVVKFAAQVLGAIVVMFIVFGMPSQTTTILGLAGAGLTVAGKDVIMAFFGWFLLMGRNGIRVGDWVEIEGVGGEVIEIGLLKTVLLETGNWTDSGHPTGRRVSFVNSFAIEGHYFNFSTSGQWMWDELQLTIPADKDPYSVVDGLQKLVAKDTAANAHEAEEEWQHTTTRYHVQAFSATPAISLRPTGSGVEVRVRYITRAYERHETRKRLYEAIVELMQGKREEVKSTS